MGKDRQEKKLRQSGRVESDRDQALHYGGATRKRKSKEMFRTETRRSTTEGQPALKALMKHANGSKMSG